MKRITAIITAALVVAVPTGLASADSSFPEPCDSSMYDCPAPPPPCDTSIGDCTPPTADSSQPDTSGASSTSNGKAFGHSKRVHRVASR